MDIFILQNHLQMQEQEIRVLHQRLEEANRKLRDKENCDDGRDARIQALECLMQQFLGKISQNEAHCK